ncbi:hypothetical protein [Candidatus Corynebacterium faecigallinarum]|uniref:hypothetical protein n=1 Tax=Candidatus Corynebacterium faecigallinarum TaxID=2838528 RepID=UPI003FD5C2C3
MPLQKNTLTTGFRTSVRPTVRPTVRKGAVLVAAVGLAVPMLTACGETRSVEAFCEVIDDNRASFDNALNTVGSGDFNTGMSQFSDAFTDLQGMWPELTKVAPEDILEDTETLNDTFGDGASEEDGDSDGDGGSGDGDGNGGGVLSGISEAAAAGDAAINVNNYVNRNC